MNKKFVVSALALLALISISSLKASAQSCPISETYGVQTLLAIDKTTQSQLEITYFTTSDQNAFISEKAGLNRSASYLNLNANQFVAKLQGLTRDGLASIRKQQSVTSYLGEVAQLNLERNSNNGQASMVNASFTSALSGLDRKTEIKVYEGPSREGDYYRVSLLSSFVNVTARGGQNVVDYDAIVLLKPGQTAVFKLASNYEVSRSGSQRSYVAVTMRSVNNAGWASLGRRP
jgi:hypothetical protein